jgi:hypothetical protein
MICGFPVPHFCRLMEDLVLLFVNTVMYREDRGARIARREKRPIALATGVPNNEASRDASAIECNCIYE